jgi:hypothetical protein
MERKNKAAAQTGVYLLVVGAILVLANLLSFKLYERFDWTRSERFTLSQGSARLVREGLKQDLSIDVYVTRGLAKHELFVQDLSDLLKEYEQASQGKLKFSIIEPKTDEEREAAKKAGLQEAAFGEGSETGADQATIKRGFMGMVFKYGSEQEVIPILSPDSTQGLEFWITNKIREIRDRADDLSQTFGIIVNKDEIKLTEANLVAAQGGGQGPNMKGILEQALPFYKFEDVDLAGGENEINPDLDGIIITQPGTDFTEKELRRIDQFLMRGDKAAAFFVSAVNLKANDATMKATIDTHGLDPLLQGYGVEMKKEALLDWGRSISIPVQTQSGQVVYFRAPGIVQAIADEGQDESTQFLDASFAGFFRLEELAFPFPSPLVPHPEKQPEAKVKVVARSTERSTVDADETIDMKISTDWKPKGEYAQQPIAVAVEGVLHSAFPGDDAGVEAPDKSPTPSRVLVVSSSQFLTNPFARAGNPPPMPPQMAMMGPMGGDQDLQMLAGPYAQRFLTATILALKNTLDWMGGDSDLIAASAKLLGEPNLTYSDIEKPKAGEADDEAAMAKKMEDYKQERAEVQRKVQWTLTFLPAAVFVGIGLARWRMRESARTKISLG